MADDPERHSLSADKLQKIYEREIAPVLFEFAKSVAQPTAIVLGGQPGAGKTPMQAQADREFSGSGGMVKIIGDDLRAFLPHYKSLQRADDKTAAFFTDRDSGRLVEKAIAEAAQRRVNVLVEGTMRSPETVAATLQQFRGAGFRTDARALAVSPEMSSLGVLQRYAAQKESRGDRADEHDRGPPECLARNARYAGPDSGRPPCRQTHDLQARRRGNP